jgi:decaprenylphospho-beta-D-erythro-pentofuranosid-2-ulose 2-reductase
MLNAFKSPQNVALIGAGSEIGQEVIKHLNQANLRRVILASRDGKQGYLNIGLPIVSDYSTSASRRKLVDEIFSHGDLDLAIVAIGLLHGSHEEIMAVNYTASVDLIALVAERMKAQAHGKILVISSFAQTRPRLDNYLYGSAKAGLDFFARGLAEELRNTGVSLTILRPGFVHTKMTAGMSAAPFSITAAEAGAAGAKAIQGSSLITFAPKILTLVAFVFGLIPQAIFRKLPAS